MSYKFNPFTGNLDNVEASYSIGNFNNTSTAKGLDYTSGSLSLHAANASNPGAVSTAAQSLAGVKTFTAGILTDSLDAAGTTITIGGTNATTINIGHSGITVNVLGSTFYENVTNLQVADKLITINKGGSAGSGLGSGLEIEENSIITGYIKTSADRNSYSILAPNTVGIITLTPGASGFTIDQGSHNPVTIGTGNGLSLATQAISLALSSTSTTGALSSTDWNTFNGKQPAGNYITALTGDITASGPGSVTATLATVNSNVGSFGGATTSGTFTVNAKGLITAASSTSIQIAESQVTNLVTDLAAKLAKATGDIDQTSFSITNNTSSAANVTSLAFSNASVRSATVFYSVTIDATSDLFESGKLYLVQRGADWIMSQTFNGDNSLVVFTVTTAGQVQYTCANYSGFVTGVVKFRALVTNV